jgi:hypothetical protein
MNQERIEPGMPVAIEGHYWVHHYQHRLPHLVRTVLTRFPECKVCGKLVRFEVVPFVAESPVGWLREDRDFEETSKKIPVRQPGERKPSVDTMEETYWYRVELKFKCECGHENIQPTIVKSNEFKTVDEVGFMMGIQPLPKCSKCERFHADELGIGVVRMTAPPAG